MTAPGIVDWGDHLDLQAWLPTRYREKPVSAMSNQVAQFDNLRQSYNSVPYPSRPVPFSFPPRLAAMAKLRGLDCVSPSRCQVLELGCADGGNLIPMATQFPDSRFVGIDLSPVQIESGQKNARELSLDNLQLHAANILDLDLEQLDRFDYIIVHGVYSWVPRTVQQRILEICRSHLSDRGVAYISYNSFPGWHGKLALQQMLRYHTDAIENPQEKVQAAIELLSHLPTTSKAPENPMAVVADNLRRDLERMDQPATYLIHEYLIDSNSPLYLHEFLEQAQAHDLQYVGDAFPGSTALERLPAASGQWVAELTSDHVRQQQYVDFVADVAFRRSVLCGKQVPLDDTVSLEQVRGLHAAATCQRDDAADTTNRFRTDVGGVVAISHPELNRLLESLIEAGPSTLPVAQLYNSLKGTVSDEVFVSIVMSLLRNAMIELTVLPHPCTATVEHKPAAAPLVRKEAATGHVTAGNYRSISLSNPLEQKLLPLLDGTRTVPDLVAIVQAELRPDPPLTEEQWIEAIRAQLHNLAHFGLLIPGAGKSDNADSD